VRNAAFIEPMLLLRTEHLPEGPEWVVELKFDGYRALAIKMGGKVQLRSRNNNDFNSRYPSIVKALAPMPDETVIDGEVVALDSQGRPSFNALQNHGSAGVPLHFFIFDLLVLRGRDVMGEPLMKRRDLIEQRILPHLAEPIRYSPILDGSVAGLIQSVKAQGLEGPSGKAPRQPIRAGLAVRCVAEDARESGPRAGDRWLHALAEKLRRPGDRLLRRSEAPLCRENPQRIYASITGRAVQKDKAS
jgi:ATP-dependent DNA ligase